MKISTVILMGILMLRPLLVSAENHLLAPDEVLKVTKTYTSLIVASYACRTTLDEGIEHYNQTLHTAKQALSAATNDRDKATKMIAELERQIENEDPAAQLVRQFDELSAGPDIRKRACQQLVKGNSQRAYTLSEELKLGVHTQ